MTRRAKHWSVSKITNPKYAGFTVRVVEPTPGAALIIYWWEKGRGQRASGLGGRTRTSLGSTPAAQIRSAKQLGMEFIAGLAERGSPGSHRDREALTLGRLVEAYRDRGLQLASPGYRRDALSCVERCRDFLGADFPVLDLEPSHVERYLAERIADGKLVAGRRDMVALSIACNWARANRRLTVNPLSDPNIRKLLYIKHAPARPFLSPEEYHALEAVAPQVVSTVPRVRGLRVGRTMQRPITAQPSAAAFPTLLALAWHTGHRIRAILDLRWESVDLTERRESPFGGITWYAGVKADHKKHEHWAPLNEPARAALIAWREHERRQSVPRLSPWVFPSTTRPDQPLDYNYARKWLRDAITLAKLPHRRQGGWHMLRRGFATARKGMPVHDLARVGGWRDTETLMRSYVHATTAETLKVALYTA